MDVDAILDGGFDRSLSGLNVFHIGADQVKARLFVSDAVQNHSGKLHGGAIATLVDGIGTLAVMTADHFHRLGVTTDLHVSYVTAGVAGDSVLIEARVVSCGLMVAFVDVTLTSETRGHVIARGQMTKLLSNASASGRTPEASARR